MILGYGGAAISWGCFFFFYMGWFREKSFEKAFSQKDLKLVWKHWLCRLFDNDSLEKSGTGGILKRNKEQSKTKKGLGNMWKKSADFLIFV